MTLSPYSLPARRVTSSDAADVETPPDMVDEEAVSATIPLTPRTKPPTPHDQALEAIQQDIFATRNSLFVLPRWTLLPDYSSGHIQEDPPLDTAHFHLAHSNENEYSPPVRSNCNLPTDQATQSLSGNADSAPLQLGKDAPQFGFKINDNLPIDRATDNLGKKRHIANLMGDDEIELPPASLEAQLVPERAARPAQSRPSKKRKTVIYEIRKENPLDVLLKTTRQGTLGGEASARKQKKPHNGGKHASEHDPTSIPGFLELRERRELARHAPVVSKAQKEYYEIPQVIGVEPSWTSNPAIRNPAWYHEALLTESHPTQPIAVLSSIDLCQERSLVRTFQEYGFDLVERDSTIQGADLVVSASTAIIFRQLRSLAHELNELLQALKQATNFFGRVLIVFDVVTYSVIDKRADAIASVNPLNPPVLKALSALRRGIAVSIVPEMGDTIGTVDMNFAVNGAKEVAQVLRVMAEDELDQVRQFSGAQQSADICGDRQWLWTDRASRPPRLCSV